VRRLGVTHASSEDEDHHLGFWGGIRIERGEHDPNADRGEEK